jgi:predicted enzyme related to lactoylglutathione lyase
MSPPSVDAHTRAVSSLAFVSVCLLAACVYQPARRTMPVEQSSGVHIGEFVWQDLMTEDPEKSRTFYEQLLGWTFERSERLGKPYLIARTGSRPVAGIAQAERRRPGDPIAQWVSYLSADNVDSAVARIAAAGGRVLVAPADTRVGRVAIAVDAQGAQIGLVRRKEGVSPPAGGPSALVGSFLWRDYFTKDVEQARTFYSNLAGFGAVKQNRPDSLVQYVLTRNGPNPVAGVVPIGTRPSEPNWLPYIRVGDPAAVAARAEQLGGRIIVQPSPDIRQGSVAVIMDPTGAAVGLQKWPFP